MMNDPIQEREVGETGGAQEQTERTLNETLVEENDQDHSAGEGRGFSNNFHPEITIFDRPTFSSFGLSAG